MKSQILSSSLSLQVLHKNNVLASRKTIVPRNCKYMVELLRFYETDSAIFLLLQHASGGKLWNYISGYLHHHSDTQLDYVFDDRHEQDLRAHKPSADSPNPLVTSQGKKDSAIKKATVTFSRNTSDNTAAEAATTRQDSTAEKDSLLDDSHLSSGGAPQKTKEDVDKDENTSTATANQPSEAQNFFDVLKAADTSMKAFSIDSFDSDAGAVAGSRMHSATSDPGVECIPESQGEVSPSKSQGDVFHTSSSHDASGAIQSAITTTTEPDACDDENVYLTLRGAEAAMESARKVLDEEFSPEQLPNVPTDNNLTVSSNEEPSIYDLHRSEGESEESGSPERPAHLPLDEAKRSNEASSSTTTTTTSTPTPSGKTSSSVSPKDPERDPVIYRMPSQERSLESEVRPRKRNLSNVFRDLDLAEGDTKNKQHLPEACVCQWAAEMIIAIGYLHSTGIICR